ncbi:unnamed protein product, partial [Vitis vinifera]
MKMKIKKLFFEKQNTSKHKYNIFFFFSLREIFIVLLTFKLKEKKIFIWKSLLIKKKKKEFLSVCQNKISFEIY